MGQSPSSQTYNTEGHGMPFFQGKTEFGEVYPTAVKWCSEPKKIAIPGDILISVRAPVGPTNLAKEECCVGRGLAAIRPRSDMIDRDFLWYFLQLSERILAEKGQGSTFEAINSDDLRSMKIPHLLLEDQRRIAALLKAQLAEVKKVREAAKAQLKEIQVLLARFWEGCLDELKDAPREPLGNLLTGIEAGKSIKTTELPAQPNELGVLKVSAVTWNEFQPQEAKAVYAGYEPETRHRVQRGDLLISRANTRELVGAVVRVSKDYFLRLLSDKTLRLMVDETRVEPKYLLNVLRWPEARSYIESHATGTSDSMRNISQVTIRDIPVPIVPRDLQVRIINRIDAFSSETTKMKKAVKSVQAHLGLLPQKLLSQVFETN